MREARKGKDRKTGNGVLDQPERGRERKGHVKTGNRFGISFRGRQELERKTDRI